MTEPTPAASAAAQRSQLLEQRIASDPAGFRVLSGDGPPAPRRPLHTRRRELVADPGYLDRVLDRGIASARELADDTLSRVHDALGMTYAYR